MVIFLNNLDIFVWIQQGCLAYRVFTLDPCNHVIKRLWCILIEAKCSGNDDATLIHHFLETSACKELR